MFQVSQERAALGGAVPTLGRHLRGGGLPPSGTLTFCVYLSSNRCVFEINTHHVCIYLRKIHANGRDTFVGYKIMNVSSRRERFSLARRPARPEHLHHASFYSILCVFIFEPLRF